MRTEYWLALVLINAASIMVCLVGLPKHGFQTRRTLRWLNFFVLSTVMQGVLVLGMHIAGIPGLDLPLLVTFGTWTFATTVALVGSRASLSVKALGVLFLCGAPLVASSYPDGIPGFLDSMDAFPAWDPESADRVGDLEESPYRRASFLLKLVYFFANAILVLGTYGRAWRDRIDAESDSDEGRPFRGRAVGQIVYVGSLGLSVIVAFVLAGGSTVSVSVVSGFIALSLSVVFRDTLQNFFNGLLVLWEGNIQVGHVISLDGNGYGVVKELTPRYLVVEDRNEISTLIPHTQLINSNVENWTKDSRRVRLKLDVGVAYGSDIAKVKEILQNVAFDVPRVLTDPMPRPTIMGLGESSIDFQLRFKVRDPEGGVRNVKSQVYEVLLRKFEEAGILIPFPQRDIRLTVEEGRASKAIAG